MIREESESVTSADSAPLRYILKFVSLRTMHK